MTRFKITMIVRPNNKRGSGREVSVGVTAETEIQARRIALERCWSERMFASNVRVDKRRAMP